MTCSMTCARHSAKTERLAQGPPASQRAPALPGLTSDEGARREGRALKGARRRVGLQSQLRPAGELSLLFGAVACGLGLYARANQAPTAKTMPTTSEPVAFSGWCPVEPAMCPGMKLGSDLAGSAR